MRVFHRSERTSQGRNSRRRRLWHDQRTPKREALHRACRPDVSCPTSNHSPPPPTAAGRRSCPPGAVVVTVSRRKFLIAAGAVGGGVAIAAVDVFGLPGSRAGASGLPDMIVTSVSRGGGTNTYNSLISSLAPSLWLKLDETSGSTAVDSSGNGFNGTYSTSGVAYNAANTAAGAGNDAGAVGLTTGTVSVPNHPAFTNLTTTAGTKLVGVDVGPVGHRLRRLPVADGRRRRRHRVNGVDRMADLRRAAPLRPAFKCGNTANQREHPNPAHHPRFGRFRLGRRPLPHLAERRQHLLRIRDARRQSHRHHLAAHHRADVGARQPGHDLPDRAQLRADGQHPQRLHSRPARRPPPPP